MPADRAGLDEWLRGLLPVSMSDELPCDPPPIMLSLLKSRAAWGDSDFSDCSLILLAYNVENMSTLCLLLGGKGAAPSLDANESGVSRCDESDVAPPVLPRDSFCLSSIRARRAWLGGSNPCRRG